MKLFIKIDAVMSVRWQSDSTFLQQHLFLVIGKWFSFSWCCLHEEKGSQNFVPWDDEVKRLEVLKWLQKSYTVNWLQNQLFASYKADDLWFLWVRIYILVFLHVAARSHICCLEFLYRANLPSLKREGGDLFCIARTRQREGDVRTPLAGFINLFVASCLYKNQEAKVKRVHSHFPRTLFTDLVSDFSICLKLPITPAFLWWVHRDHELRAKIK